MRISDAVPAHVLRISSALHATEAGTDGTVPTANVATALTALQDNSMSTWRPVFANARKLFRNLCNPDGCMCWKSGLQPIVTLSSCEAEYVALCLAVCEVKYLRSLLSKLGFGQQDPTLIWEDNRTTILVAENESSSAGRCKHIDVRFRFVAEAVRDGVVRVRYCPSAYNYADIMTKPLVPTKFVVMRDMCAGEKTDQFAQRGVTDDSLKHKTRDVLCAESFMIYM